MIKTYIGLHVKYPLFLSDLNETRIFSKKYVNIKFHENPASRSQGVPCRQTDGRTDGHDEPNGSFSQFCE